jgi:hypothetical protein
MLRHLRRQAGNPRVWVFVGHPTYEHLPPKLRLFAAAACGRLAPLLESDQARDLLALAGRFADSPPEHAAECDALRAFYRVDSPGQG